MYFASFPSFFQRFRLAAHSCHLSRNKSIFISNENKYSNLQSFGVEKEALFQYNYHFIIIMLESIEGKGKMCYVFLLTKVQNNSVSCGRKHYDSSPLLHHLLLFLFSEWIFFILTNRKQYNNI